MTSAPTEDVRFTTSGRVGRITLDRPGALNALTLGMIRSIDRALDTCSSDESIEVVVLDSTTAKAFCAGGDIRAFHSSALAADDRAQTFWTAEYQLDARLARFPKPVVALMDGIVLGGGVGLASHAGIRLVTERSSVGMPEVAIGFAPDVGSTWLLSRSPSEVGTYLALTGRRIGPADAIALGLADSLVPSHDLPALVDALSGSRGATPEEIVGRWNQEPAGHDVSGGRDWIDDCFAADAVEEILDRLDRHPDGAARRAAVDVRAGSPTAVAVTRRALTLARELPSLEHCLDQELRVACAFLTVPDFVEGIRAMVIDKDRSPCWHPATAVEVPVEAVDRHFRHLGGAELGLADWITTVTGEPMPAPCPNDGAGRSSS